MPLGFEKRGTHHMPLMDWSAFTRRSTSSMSGPCSFMATGIIWMPRSSQMAKWRS